MASFYKVQPHATAFIARLFVKVGWKNIGKATTKDGRFFITLKNNKVLELTLKEVTDESKNKEVTS